MDTYKREVIKGFSQYEIDTEGIVYNKKGKPLQSNTKGGYASVCLCQNGVSYVKRVHRLMMEQFTDKKDWKKYVVHLNGKKEDNRLNNLAWSDSNYEGYLESTKEQREEMNVLKEIKAEKRVQKHIVCACDEIGHIVKEYKSIAEAARSFTDNEHSGKVFISNAIKTSKKAFGYYWKRPEDLLETYKDSDSILDG